MRKNKLYSLLLTSALFLSACGFFPDPVDPDQPAQEDLDQVEEGQENDETEDETSIVEVQIDSGYYRPVINEDGTYAPSQSRGITKNLNSNINIKTFENDLMRLSQRYFPTDTHFFQEGQYIPSDLVTSWLRRQEPENDEQSEDSEETEETVDRGLNPEATGSTDPNERNPNYLSSILEHNFYVQTEDGLELSGVSIGLALNSVDYYPEYQFGPTLEQEIPTDELLQEGKRMSDEIISQMREISGLEDVPIMVALFEQSRQDNLAAGTYIAEGISENGNTSISNWTSVNENRIVFPLENMQSAEGNNFANFRSEVEGFFPNVSGITGVAHYVEEQLVHLQIDIMTQFYGKGEIIAFTQFINEAATNFLPADVPVEIRLESLNGMESFLYRDSGEEDYEVYIFN
ncbi:CamS family sex pheromone protein [Alkalibacterium olivapovliticus]|uniref:Protein involved in sex pheromone biosynthesis n=1 Tax=Alkalibacterium olivapovliticus TaxID=99907 RepID=A0A2T0W8A4_9LACT|nr:CamS family sex pheromone protein [Alkalibacterium olivapovliticus]PRY82886.1 protein involved in sex pheromone biosynthesis [Alkalibacterium olivapovliticus]